jgi:hypothetical protein
MSFKELTKTVQKYRLWIKDESRYQIRRMILTTSLDLQFNAMYSKLHSDEQLFAMLSETSHHLPEYIILIWCLTVKIALGTCLV